MSDTETPKGLQTPAAIRLCAELSRLPLDERINARAQCQVIGEQEQALRDTARRAAELLTQYGWTQGRQADMAGRMCLVGACAKAATGNPWDQRWVNGVGATFERLRQRTRLLVAAHDPGGDGEPFPWNDRPGRTAEEVIALLQRIAAGEGYP